MNTEEFRRHAHELVDWMADYMDNVESYPVRAQVKPGEIAATLPAAPPEEPEPMAAIMADFERDILPGITHWQHPSFFAYFPANASPPSVLAEMLTATLGVQGMMWQTSPAATELETRMMEWLRQMTGLPEGLAGTIQDSASTATLCALLVAREKATGWRANATGLAAEAAEIAVYCSAEAHSATEKDAGIIGIGRENVRSIPVGVDFAMRPRALRDAIEEDLANGITPACVVATLGSTGAGGFDPLRDIGEICARYGIFLHVDAAWAGSALLLPEQRWMLDGVAYADSFVFNPHKWLFTNFDCSAHFMRDSEALVRTLAITPHYLKSRGGAEVIDYRDWTVPLGRRFRALKLWFVIRSYGVEGLRRRIAEHIALAQGLAEKMKAEPHFEVLSPARLALFNFRYRPEGFEDGEALDRLNEALINRINDSGALYLTQNRIGDAFCIRFSVGQTATEKRHVDAAWEKIKEIAQSLPKVASG